MNLFFFAGVMSGVVAAASKPHILAVLVDDFGWANVGWHRSVQTPEVHTPVMDQLVKEGIELNRHYVHYMCTPSRASFQTGRLPVHMITQLADPCDHNGAIPRNITGIAAQLKKGGYATHQVGKWDAGMATPYHTPHGRGYDSSLNYFGHGNWMWTQRRWRGSCNHQASVPSEEVDIVDFWDTDKPANSLNGTGYEEFLFRDRLLEILRNHDQSKPLFLNYDSKVAHYPMQAPEKYQKMFDFIPDVNRRMYHAMVAVLDENLGIVKQEMQRLGMWDNTLMILTSDNGGYVKNPEGPCNITTSPNPPDNSDIGHGAACFNGEAGANNYPLQGGKYSKWEGGIRVNAFVSGGFVPAAQRGTKSEGIVHIADWYGTFCHLAGVDPFDSWANASGLPGVDSVNVWPYLSGQQAQSPRSDFLVDSTMIVAGKWKYVEPGTKMVEAAHGGPHYPNASTATDPIDSHSWKCPATGCLFDLEADLPEMNEISAQHPDIVKQLNQLLQKEKATIWKAEHKDDPECEKTANERYGGFFGPWLELPSQNN